VRGLILRAERQMADSRSTCTKSSPSRSFGGDCVCTWRGKLR